MVPIRTTVSLQNLVVSMLTPPNHHTWGTKQCSSSYWSPSAVVSLHPFHPPNMCLLLELWEALKWALMWAAGISNEHLPSRRNTLSSSPRTILVRIDPITAFDGFWDRLDWLKVKMDRCFSLLSWTVLAIIWVTTVVEHGTHLKHIKKARNSTSWLLTNHMWSMDNAKWPTSQGGHQALFYWPE